MPPLPPTLGADDLHVQVRQAAGHRLGEDQHPLHRHRVPVQVVVQRAALVVLGHQPQLRPRAVVCGGHQFTGSKLTLPGGTRLKGLAASSGNKAILQKKRPNSAAEISLALNLNSFLATLICSARLKSATFVVGSDEAQDVLVSQHDGLIDVGLAKPRPLVPGGEDLDGHVLPPPLPSPHLAEATLPDGLLQDDGAGDGALHQQGEACEGERLRQTCPPTTSNGRLPAAVPAR